VQLAGVQAGKSFPVDREATLGRETTCEVHIPSIHVSRHHARISRNERNDYVLEDLESRNGTFLNGEAINKSPLRFGDKIQLASDTILMFTYYDRAEEHLLQSQKMESIGRLASGFAHDFNNLLAALVSSFQYLEELPDKKAIGNLEVRECLSEMKEATQRAVDLTRSLLGFARMEREELSLTSVSDILNELCRLFRRNFGSQIELISDIQPNLWVLGDSVRLHQMFSNLGFNARDAMPNGGQLTIKAKRVKVSAKESLDLPGVGSRETVMITVADTGCGMDEETRKRAYEPFFSTKGADTGTGLGLAIVYGAVKNHSGHISLSSREDVGTTFKIYLPAQDATASGRITLSSQELSFGDMSGEEHTTVVMATEDISREKKKRRDPGATLTGPKATVDRLDED
jgi:signal transduction histidine kinase